MTDELEAKRAALRDPEVIRDALWKHSFGFDSDVSLKDALYFGALHLSAGGIGDI